MSVLFAMKIFLNIYCIVIVGVLIDINEENVK